MGGRPTSFGFTQSCSRAPPLAEFQSKWLDWNPEEKREGFVSFVSTPVARSQKQNLEPGDESRKEGNHTQPRASREETRERVDSGQEFLFQKRPTMALTKLTKPPCEPSTELAGLERDWVGCGVLTVRRTQETAPCKGPFPG